MDHSHTAPDGDLLPAFLGARYTVFLPEGPIELRPGRIFTTPRAPAGTPWALLTAHNPRGVARPAADNAAAQARLLAQLRDTRLPCWPGRNADMNGKHAEDSVFTLGLETTAADALAHAFGQCALLAGCIGGPARLRCIGDCWPEPVVDTAFVDWVASDAAHPRSP